MHYKNNKGFTFNEVIIAISILLILMVSFVRFSNTRWKKTMCEKLADGLMQTSLQYYMMYRIYPTQQELLKIFTEMNMIVEVINPYTGSTQGIEVVNSPDNTTQTIYIKDKNGTIISSRTLSEIYYETATSKRIQDYYWNYSVNFPFKIQN